MEYTQNKNKTEYVFYKRLHYLLKTLKWHRHLSYFLYILIIALLKL